MPQPFMSTNARLMVAIMKSNRGAPVKIENAVERLGLQGQAAIVQDLVERALGGDPAAASIVRAYDKALRRPEER